MKHLFTSKRGTPGAGVTFLVLSLATLIFTGLGQAENDDQGEAAAQVARAWFNSLMQGDTEVTTSLSVAPFSFDGKHEIATLAELKKLYESVVAKKGKRNIEVSSATVESSSPERIVVLITIEGDDETISVFVKPGEALRISGFQD